MDAVVSLGRAAWEDDFGAEKNFSLEGVFFGNSPSYGRLLCYCLNQAGSFRQISLALFCSTRFNERSRA